MKTRKMRKSPQESATEVPEGTIRLGGNREFWVAKRIGKSNRWIPSDTAELFGLRRLTLEDIIRSKDTSLIFYEREYCSNWPTMKDHECQLYKVTFVPSGDAGVVGRKPISKWLDSQSPPIKDRTVFMIYGILQYNTDRPFKAGLQVNSRNHRVSSRLTNMEAFIKI